MHPKGIIARNDPRVRLLEGLEQNVTVLHGDIPDKVAVREGKVEYDVDLRHGQKTGAFLDQRENRIAAAQYVSGGRSTASATRAASRCSSRHMWTS